MTQYRLFIPVFLLCCMACSNKSTKPEARSSAEPAAEIKPVRYTSFELSYGDAWREHWTIYSDSMGLFYIPDISGPEFFHELPDSLAQAIDSLTVKLRTFPLIKRKPCDNCEHLSVLAVRNGDTLRYIQTGTIEPEIRQLIQKLKPYMIVHKSLKNVKHVIRTHEDVIVPLPPIIKPDIIDEEEAPPPIPTYEEFKNQKAAHSELAN